MADPRKGGADTVNEMLKDQALRHRLGLDRLSGSVRNDVIELLNAADGDIEGRMSFLLDRGRTEDFVRGNKLTQLRNEIHNITGQAMGDVKDKWRSKLKDVAKSEGELQAGQLKNTIPVDVGVGVPNANTLEAVVTAEPFRGNTLSGWANKVTKDRTTKIMNEVRQGIVSGDSNQEIVSRVMGTRQFNFKNGVLNKTRNNVAAITRTAVTDVSERARDITFQRNSNVMRGIQYVATLDSRTTIICASLDGKVFDIGKGPRPSQHFDCRSVTTPVTKSWRELGVDRDEMTPSTRASMDGQVAGDKSIRDFLDSPKGPSAEDILGKTRAKLWRKGDLDFQDFLRGGIRQNNEIMTLKELRQQQSEAFQAIA